MGSPATVDLTQNPLHKPTFFQSASGVLVALGYNGNIWLLRDTDADGLEDQATLFWEGKGKITAPIGMDLAPQGTAHGDAVFFACQGKVMMVTDRNGDGQAEETRVLAEGWPLARAGIDAASTCFDPRDGSLYFGLGVRWYDNAYEIDDQGRAHNTLESERGAILRLSPDFKTRERLVTGVRWPIGLRFIESINGGPTFGPPWWAGAHPIADTHPFIRQVGDKGGCLAAFSQLLPLLYTPSWGSALPGTLSPARRVLSKQPQPSQTPQYSQMTIIFAIIVIIDLLL